MLDRSGDVKHICVWDRSVERRLQRGEKHVENSWRSHITRRHTGLGNTRAFFTEYASFFFFYPPFKPSFPASNVPVTSLAERVLGDCTFHSQKRLRPADLGFKEKRYSV